VQSWPAPSVPSLPSGGLAPELKDTASGTFVQPVDAGPALLYVCGITPYDSTHLGHAATYVAFDTLVRTWRDAGLGVRYVQNITDIDDPLLERAEATGVDWRELAASQVQLFTTDMAALRVIPPDHYIGVVEAVDLVADGVQRMVQRQAAYRVPVSEGEPAPEGTTPGTRFDIYADMSADERVGSLSGLDEATMDIYFAERGGDPEREGKRHRRDPLLWRAARAGEPWFDGGPLGPGRPGWHVECSVIAEQYLGTPIHLQGGGTDLIYPHHEMSISHLRVLTQSPEPARAYLHTGLVAFEGHKMSKSRGNLVFVSRLVTDGVPAAAVRLTALAHHYTEDWEYTDAELSERIAQLHRWQAAAGDDGGADLPARSGTAVLADLRAALSQDLNTPRAVAIIDDWAAAPGTPADIALVTDAVDALLGIDLR